MSALRANPALWLLIGVPAAAVVMGVVIVTLATNGPTDLVRDDYYKAGLAINADLSAEEAGAALGLTGSLAPRGPGRVLVTIEQTQGPRETDPTIWLELAHPTLAAEDLRVRAEAAEPGRWVAIIPAFAGRRTLLAYPEDVSWRLHLEGLRAPQAPAP